jgi:hypothetical protein
LFVGDSDTLGTQAAPGFPTVTCRALGWNCQVDAQTGTGYRSSGDGSDASSRPYGARLAKDVARFPNVSIVVVTGGRADLGRSGEARAAEDYESDDWLASDLVDTQADAPNQQGQARLTERMIAGLKTAVS